MPKKAIGILGTGAYAPERILTNKDLEQMVETSDEWIVSRTGSRSGALPRGDAASDLAVRAAESHLQGRAYAQPD